MDVSLSPATTGLVKISLTDFTNFLNANPRAKREEVRKILLREDAFDYWQAFRRQVTSYHRNNHPLDWWDTAHNVAHADAVENYRLAAAAYKRLVKTEKGLYVPHEKVKVEHAGLRIQVEPTIVLDRGGKLHFIKLWIKVDESLERGIIAPILQMLQDAYGSGSNCVYQYWDVLTPNHTKRMTHKTSPYGATLYQREMEHFMRIYGDVKAVLGL